MPPPEIDPFDWQRIFVGDVPLWFGLEIAARTAFMYLFALGAVRVVSRRAVGELSFVEFLLVIALGSAVGDPMFYPDVPVLHGMIVVAVVVALNRGVTALVNRAEPVERAIEGRPFSIVEDGRMRPDEMGAARLNREKLFELLRVEGVGSLGEVRRAYMEQRGVLSLVRYGEGDRRAGLRVTPPWDLETPDRIEAGDDVVRAGRWGCERCGEARALAAGGPAPPCPRCGGRSWADAVAEPDAGGAGGPAG